jgi:transcription initiation factor IIE alpha subunit
MSIHAHQINVTQFELSKLTMKNIFKFKLTPATKLVLLGLIDHYPNIYPSQKTIANKLGLSLATVKRAIAELRDKNLIITSEKEKLSLTYRFTDIFFTQINLTPEKIQNETSNGIKLSHKQITKQNNKKTFQKNNANKHYPHYQQKGINYPSANGIIQQIEDYKKTSACPLDLPKDQQIIWYNNLPPIIKNSYFATQIKKKHNL